MSQYRTGTVDVTNGSQTVTGTLTLWLAEVAVGDLFTVIGSALTYEVAAITSDTSLTLTANYGGTTNTGVEYAITRDFTPNAIIPYLTKGDIDTATTLKRAMEVIDAQLGSTSASSAVATVIGTVDLTSATVQDIGTATGVPANATIIQVKIDVVTASDAATTITVGDVTNGAASYMAASENFADSVGIYIAETFLLNGSGARQAQATVATAGTVGTATCLISYRTV